MLAERSLPHIRARTRSATSTVTATPRHGRYAEARSVTLREVRGACLVIALGACGPKPHIYFPSHRVVALGEPIPVRFAWFKLCTEDHRSIFDKNDKPVEHEPCEGVKSSLELTCTNHCDVSGSNVAIEAPVSTWPEMTVVPLELGMMAIKATLTRTDSGESSSKTQQLVVQLPGVEICAVGVVSTERWRDAIGPCDHAPLDPRNARVLVRLYVPDHASDDQAVATYREVHSDLARVNDRKLPITSTVALADLFPNAVSNGAVQPGSYPLVVSLGNKVLVSEQVVVGPTPGSTSAP